MDWREEAAGDLPRPSPREPRTLRQDLLDEVQDHLLLAAEQERETNENASDDEIRKSVIERFGNPAAVVRRLWWDAMKEVIMRDRIIATAAVVTAVAFVLFVAGVWMQMSKRQDALLSAIQELKQGDARPEYEATLVLHRGSLDGPPAGGIEVQVTHKPPEGNAVGVEDVTGPDGSVMFKFQNEGNYDLTLFDPVSSMTLEKQLTIFAGHGEGEHHIAAPNIGSAELRLQSPLPPEISDEEALLLVELGCQMIVDGSKWRYDREFLVGHQGATKEFRRVGRGARSPTWEVDSEYLDTGSLSFENQPAPDLPVSLLTVSPAVLELGNTGIPFLNNRFVVPMRDLLTEYPSGRLLLEPGAEAQLIPIEENMLEKWLEVIRYQRGMRLTGDTDWARLLKDGRDAFLRQAQPCIGASVKLDAESGLRAWLPSSDEESVPNPKLVTQALKVFGKKEAVFIQSQQTFNASKTGDEIEIVFARPRKEPMEGPPSVYSLEERAVKELETEAKEFEVGGIHIVRIALPAELQRIQAGAQFLITIPNTSPDYLLRPVPLLAEFEEIDLTLAKRAMELCSDGK